MSGEIGLAYLKVAKEAADRGQWEAAELNAKEAATYFDIEKRTGHLTSDEHEDGDR